MPDLLLRAACVRGRVTDVLVSGGSIAAMGPALPVPATPEVEVRDLQGRTLLPGLWDHHVHFDQWALARRRLDLSAAGSAAEVASLVALRLREEPGTPLVGQGFRDALWPDVPHRSLLDAASGDVPVVLVSGDLHCCWLNSAAAGRYGFAHHPSGVIRETDWHPIMEDVRKVPAAVLEQAAAAAARAAAARGVVGIVDYEAPFQLDAWAARIAGGTDSVRVVASVWPGSLDEPIARGLRTGAVVPDTGGLLTMGPLKVVTDGSLNTRTAYCHDPYPGTALAENPCGMLLVPPDELGPLLRRAAEHGIDAAVHAIGDAANTHALDTFAAAGIRGRVEHAQLLTRADVARFAELGAVASVQPEHAVDDRDVADRYWAGRTGRSFAYRSLLDAGVPLLLGSDAPVAPLDPWITLAAAVHRSSDGRPSWHPEQEIPVDAALAASAAGPIAPGRRADLVIVDRDPATATSAELRTMPVAGTLLGGRWTHRAGL
ncbi:MAG: amidohydrolase family protein [Pseudonocardia sp.]|nr:amidohydrolase family protein [Pseudonocardia sp.]